MKIKDSSNTENVLVEKFQQSVKKSKEIADMRKYIENQNVAIITLQQEIERKNKEIEHLKSMLDSCIPLLDTKQENNSISDEELICVTQISKLKKKAMEGDLTVDEVKMFDTLVKNLRLIRGESTENKAEAKFKDVNPTKLLEIAKKEIK